MNLVGIIAGGHRQLRQPHRHTLSVRTGEHHHRAQRRPAAHRHTSTPISRLRNHHIARLHARAGHSQRHLKHFAGHHQPIQPHAQGRRRRRNALGHESAATNPHRRRLIISQHNRRRRHHQTRRHHPRRRHRHHLVRLISLVGCGRQREPSRRRPGGRRDRHIEIVHSSEPHRPLNTRTTHRHRHHHIGLVTRLVRQLRPHPHPRRPVALGHLVGVDAQQHLRHCVVIGDLHRPRRVITQRVTRRRQQRHHHRLSTSSTHTSSINDTTISPRDTAPGCELLST